MYRLMRTLGLAVILVALFSGCVSTKNFELLQAEVRDVDAEVEMVGSNLRNTNERIDSLKSLTADVEAVRTYFLEVKENVRQMRDETILLLDEYRVGIEETRGAYISALKGQQQTIQGVIEKLEQKVPAGSSRMSKPPADPVKGVGSRGIRK